MNKLKGDLSPNYVMKYFLKRKHQGFNILIQGCQNVLATGAISPATLRFSPAVNCWRKGKNRGL